MSGDLTESLIHYAEENNEDYIEGFVGVEYTGEEIKFEKHNADYYKTRAEYY